MLGVYVHIPFCERKCSYCAFSSFVSSEVEQEKYINSLIQEIEDFAKCEKREIDTIYIGGGTPSLLSINLMQKVIKTLKDNFIWNDNLEFTIEANPNSISQDKLSFYKECGINRISIGIQSLDDDKLKTIGRLHSAEDAINAVKLSKKYFQNISVDMLIGLPNMNIKVFLKEIEYLTSLNVNHISAYMLQVEDGTPLARKVKCNNAYLPDDDESVLAYEEMSKLLKEKGFERYEVSNFAKENFCSRHNFKYWTGEDYIGFGLSAHSYINGERWANSKNFDKYYDRKIAMREKLSSQQLIEEHIMLGLRCCHGIDKSYLFNLGYNIEENQYLKDFIEKGIIRQNCDKNRLYLNPNFYGVNNYIIVHLLP